MDDKRHNADCIHLLHDEHHRQEGVLSSQPLQHQCRQEQRSHGQHPQQKGRGVWLGSDHPHILQPNGNKVKMRGMEEKSSSGTHQENEVKKKVSKLEKHQGAHLLHGDHSQ